MGGELCCPYDNNYESWISCLRLTSGVVFFDFWGSHGNWLWLTMVERFHCHLKDGLKCHQTGLTRFLMSSFPSWLLLKSTFSAHLQSWCMENIITCLGNLLPGMKIMWSLRKSIVTPFWILYVDWYQVLFLRSRVSRRTASHMSQVNLWVQISFWQAWCCVTFYFSVWWSLTCSYQTFEVFHYWKEGP